MKKERETIKNNRINKSVIADFFENEIDKEKSRRKRKSKSKNKPSAKTLNSKSISQPKGSKTVEF